MAESDEREGAQGFLLDDRFYPPYNLRPLWFACGQEPTGYNFPQPSSQTCRPQLWIKEFGQEARLAGAAEIAAFEEIDRPFKPAGASADASNIAWNSDRTSAVWTERDRADLRGFRAPLRLHTDRAMCERDPCRGRIERVWWIDGHLVFLRSEGHAFRTPALYVTDAQLRSIRRIFAIDGALDACVPAPDSVVCLISEPLSPPRIAAIQVATGRITTLYDPTPVLRQRISGYVELLEWKDGYGNDARAHLLYPSDYDRRRRYPLVVVQYSDRGFLNGGTGN